MTTLVLKLIAYFTMLIDHTAVSLWITGRMREMYTLYRVMRGIGRIAFPIFCFQLVQGAMYTKNKKKYLLRLLLFAVISEVPFDLALFGRLYKPGYQNVFFTLLLGLICVYVIQWGSRLPGKKVWLGWGAAVLTTGAAGLLAEYVVLSDYGWAGVFMIAIMGILAAPLRRIRYLIRSEYFLQMFVSAFGIAACILLTNSTESFALLALIPIYFYNGVQGITSKRMRLLLYVFYPLHLAVLGLVFVWPLVRSLYL